MADSYREVSSEGWGSRLGKAVKGVVVGLVLFLVSFPLLFWNEGRAIQTAKSLEEGAHDVVSIPADKVNPDNEGKLVHLTARAEPQGTLTDPDFGISLNAIRLRRIVEMYQWKERQEKTTRKKLGGGEETVTDYKYDKGWSDNLQDSSKFKVEEGHENPAAKPFQDKTWQADDVKVGDFRLSKGLIDKIRDEETLPPKAPGSDSAVGKLPEGFKIETDYYYKGKGPDSPAVGDVRVSFKVVKPTTVSLVARQKGNTFEPYTAKAGDTYELLQTGEHNAQEMFSTAQARNVTQTWIFRLVGFAVMGVGLYLVFNPFVVFADVVPFMGNLLSMGVALFAFVVALALSLITIALGWVFYRPLVGIPLLVVGVASLTGLVVLGRRRRAARALERDSPTVP
jgi:hypothetical protein